MNGVRSRVQLSEEVRPVEAGESASRQIKRYEPEEFLSGLFVVAVVWMPGDVAPVLQLVARVVSKGFIVAIFLVAQAWDGILTYAAVQLFGPAAEGNPLLATWIAAVGPEIAIIGAKLLASGCGVLLHCLGIHRVLLGLTLLYAAAAIGPWLAIFHAIR